jgi:hypothetical protein
MTLEEMKQRLRASGGLRPENELSLSVGIDTLIQIVWDAHDWTYKLGVDTFTTTGDATWKLPVEVDSVLQLTYGTNNRVVQSIPSSRVSDLYDNVPRTGSRTYYYHLYSTEPDQITIEMVPTPPSGRVFTYYYRRKIVEGDLSKIPSKLHPLVLLGTGIFLKTGDPYASPAFASMLAHAIAHDKPISRQRWSMGLDDLTKIRIASRNTMIGDGSTGNTARPYD